MAAHVFEFWDDYCYESYGLAEQAFLNDRLRDVSRLQQVSIPGTKYTIYDFDGVERGQSMQVNSSTSFRRHVRLQPPNLVQAPPPQSFKFQYFDGFNWSCYEPCLQQDFSMVAQRTPPQAKHMFTVSGQSYVLLGLDSISRGGGGQIQQMNVISRTARPVRASEVAKNDEPIDQRLEFLICGSSSSTATNTPMCVHERHEDSHRVLLDALLQPARPEFVKLPTGDVIEGFRELELGGAGVRGPQGEWIQLDLRLRRQWSSGSLSLPQSLQDNTTFGVDQCGCFLQRDEIAKLPASTTDDARQCAICLTELEPDDDGDTDLDNAAFRLKCGHLYHYSCLENWFGTRRRCPTCSRSFGILMGDQPRIGRMQWCMEQHQLPGYPKTIESIAVSFLFPAGTDENGAAYSARNETGYLPGNAQGAILLELFKVAFRRRIMFGLGNSMTTGVRRATFNIHIKTKTHGGEAQHGYPDETYFKRALDELQANGVTIESLRPPTATI